MRSRCLCGLASLHSALEKWQRQAFVNGTGVPYVAAQGNGGQYIFIVPDYDLVVVFTGSNYDSGAANQPYSILQSLILPAFTPG